MLSPTLINRLKTDRKRLKDFVSKTPYITFQTPDCEDDDIPLEYKIIFNCISVVAIDGYSNPVFGEHHQCSVYLGNQYPARAPEIKWLTPIYHSNIRPPNVCINAREWASGRFLDDLVHMLYEMATWRNFWNKCEPPYPLDLDAAEWSRDAIASGKLTVPTDTRPLFYPQDCPSEVPAVTSSKKIKVLPQAAPVPTKIVVKSGNNNGGNNGSSRIKIVNTTSCVNNNNQSKIKVLSGNSRIKVLS
ncbi:MAG: hypothetical protein ABRQ37_25820 [Candidatus Eremiobacterota bacterium]